MLKRDKQTLASVLVTVGVIYLLLAAIDIIPLGWPLIQVGY